MRLRQFAISGVLLLVLRTMTGSIRAMPQQDSAAGAVTFNKHVLPVLQKNCQTCHRPGEIAPMSFLTYRDVRPWAKAIKAAVVKRQMPPWFADPAYGHFANDKRLTDAEIVTLSAWADSGAVEGDANDKPAPIAFHDGWNVEPDMIIEMPNGFNVPATGTVTYKNILVKKSSPEDVWVLAAEMRPGNPQVAAPWPGPGSSAGIGAHEGRCARRSIRDDECRNAAKGRCGDAGQIQSGFGPAGFQSARIGKVRSEGIGPCLQSALHLDRQSGDRSIPGGPGLREKATDTSLR